MWKFTIASITSKDQLTDIFLSVAAGSKKLFHMAGELFSEARPFFLSSAVSMDGADLCFEIVKRADAGFVYSEAVAR